MSHQLKTTSTHSMIVVILFSLCISQGLIAQDSTHPLANKLKDFIGQKFQIERKGNQTIDITLREVTPDYVLFVAEERDGVEMIITRPLCYISRLLSYRFHGSDKEYLNILSFANDEDLKAVPWPPDKISSKDKTHIQSVQLSQASKDALINDLNNIAAYAYQYKIRPKSMGGGGGSFEGVTLPTLLVSNENGRYSCLFQSNYLLLMAISNLNSNNVIKVKLDDDGRLSDWKYFGDFE